MTDPYATMQLALDALELRCGTHAEERNPDGAIAALRAALAEKPEPVACGKIIDVGGGNETPSQPVIPTLIWFNGLPPIGTVLYTSPPARVPLTYAEIYAEWKRLSDISGDLGESPGFGSGIRFAERHHGIKD